MLNDSSIHPQLVLEDDHIVACNMAFIEAFGYSRELIIGQSFTSLFIDNPSLFKRLYSTKQFDFSHQPVHLIKFGDGNSRPVQFERSQLDHRELVSLRLLPYYNTDPITGLNMGWILDITADEFYKNQDNNPNLGYLIVRVDNFASVNFRYSYAIGDRYLVTVGQLLSQCLGSEWLVTRYSGAKFGILHIGDSSLANESYHNYIQTCCQRLIHLFDQPIEIENLKIRKNLSIGATSNAGLYSDFKAFDIATEIAFSRAVKSSRSNFKFASEFSETSGLVRKKMLVDDIQAAVEGHEINVVYQPLYRVASRTVIGFEALARWEHNSLGNISPLEFIGIAEECGYHQEFDLYILKKVCQQIVQWRGTYQQLPPVAVNFSAKTCQNMDLAHLVEDILVATQCPAEAIEIEITETAEITHYDELFTNFDAINAIGIKLVLDDFGTGYSSLQMLRQLSGRISKLKIDRQFITDIHHDPFNQLLFRQTVETARMLNIKVLAEGIEEEDELILLAAGGCDFAQGYYLHRPATVEALTPLLIKLK